MKYLVSVIIPIYNNEKYLQECLSGVLKQTYNNLEIILIDDGSTDSSGDICDKYSENNSKIKVIHQVNKGAAAARNNGILNSRGEYIVFLDGDDYWDDIDFLEKSMKNILESNSDIINFGFKKYYEDINILEESKYIFNRDIINFINKEKTLKYLISNNLYISSSCTKIIRRNLIIENNILFREDSLCEDIDWNARLLIYSNIIDVINISPYIYRQRKESKTHNLTVNNIIDLVESIELCVSLKSKTVGFEYEYMSYIAYQYITLLVCLNSIKEDIPLEIMKKIKYYTYLLKYDLIKRVHIFNLINKFLGFSMLNLFIKFYLKIRKG